MSKQTAVDYLFERLCGENGYVDTYYMDVIKKIEAIYEEAKAMEREQIIKAFCEGYDHDGDNYDGAEIKYYQETYKGGEK